MATKRKARSTAASGELTYESAGVSVAANARWVDRIKHMMRTTYGPRVANRHNAFAGLFRLDYDEQLFRRNFKKPVLVGCTDGVGSKIMLATQVGDLSTIGIDLVAMNVNDLITTGGEGQPAIVHFYDGSTAIPQQVPEELRPEVSVLPEDFTAGIFVG